MNTFFGLVVPFLDHLGIRSEHYEDGRTTVSCEVTPALTNHLHSAHGGLIGTLLDVAMSSAARLQLPPGDAAVTVTMTQNFIRAPGQGVLRAHGQVRQALRSLVFCDAELIDAEGRLVATASGTFRVLRARPEA
ncbi:MAG: PaaI family thioesterase [Rubrivivax sp.]|nr:PaaI family thioesterase [Rubrivivax sp.]